MTQMFVPMSRPSSIQYPAPPNISNNNMKPSQPLLKEAPVDENYVHDAEALAHILFRCPAVVEAYVERWMAFDIEKDANGLQSIERLFQMVVTHAPIIHITSRPVKNSLGHPDGYDNLIAFLINYQNPQPDHAKHHDYELSQKHLNDVTALRSGEFANLFRMRLAVLLTGLLCHDNNADFRQKRINASKTAATFGGFKYDALMASIHDRSAYAIYLIVFLLRYCVTMVPPPPPPQADAPTPVADKPREDVSRARALEDTARQESAFEIRALLDRLVPAIRSFSGRTFIVEDEIPEQFCWYHEGEHNGDTVLFGVPIEIVTHEWWSILWLEWVWSAAVWRQPSKINPHQSIGLLRIMEDLWRAKSQILMATYVEFFVDWDEKRLLPFLERFESAK